MRPKAVDVAGAASTWRVIADLSQAELACRVADSPAASLHSQALALIHRGPPAISRSSHSRCRCKGGPLGDAFFFGAETAFGPKPEWRPSSWHIRS